MNCRGVLIIATALRAADARLITTAAVAAATIVAIVTTTMTGPLLSLAARGRRRALRIGECAQ